MTKGSSSRPCINCELVREAPSGLAWLLDDGATQFWFPKSQGELYKRADGTYNLFAEEWLLKKKGLI